MFLSFFIGAIFNHIFGPFEVRKAQFRFVYLDMNTGEASVTPWSDSREKIDEIVGRLNLLSKELDMNTVSYTEESYIVKPGVLPFW
jgi:hypothetical protein